VGATLGSTSHFFPALVERAAGVKFKYVSYEGTAPRMTALMGGHIDLAESNLTQKSKVEAGQMKFLAIASAQRAPEIPNVPTLKELGIDITFSVNRGLVAPKGTPAAVMSKLESACAAAARDPEFAESMRTQGTRVNHLGGRQYLDFLKKNDSLNKELAGHLGMLKK
jgi:tripartite-type tricarboxylate transporter receptor subunit TctC